MLDHLKPNEFKIAENNDMISIIIKNFQNAFDSKNKNGKIQFGSLLSTIYPSYELLKKVTKRNFHRSLFTTLNYHNAYIGCGKPPPVENKSEKNRELKVIIVQDLIQFCRDNCNITAKVRKTKHWPQPIPLMYRTMTKSRLITKFTEYRINKMKQNSNNDDYCPEYIAIRNSELYDLIKII